MNIAPVVIFLYNRPYQTIKTLIHLKKNYLSRSTDLIIFSDCFKKKNRLDEKKVQLVRNIIKNIHGFRSKKILHLLFVILHFILIIIFLAFNFIMHIVIMTINIVRQDKQNSIISL